jgi:hypothetical protein
MKKEYMQPSMTVISFIARENIAIDNFAVEPIGRLSDGDILIDTDDL